ncbi:MAG TPA: hypothetical protein VGY55_19080 [Pirellulales bacterium]|jgi:hypothetical protein|nr:hypothetical protein [Pirellulales bacterium]
MKRNEVLSLLERFPELVDGDDDLLNELITDTNPDRPEKNFERSEPLPKPEFDERLAKQPR